MRIDIRAVGLLAAVLIALAFGPSLVRHGLHATNPLFFNDDVRQHIFPLFRYTEASTVSRDIPGDYHLALMPLGFRLLYGTLAPVVDPELLSKMLPYVLFLATLLGVGMAARRLGGPIAAFMTLALALQTPIFFSAMVGGLARSFSFPFISLGFWALVAGRSRILAALTVLAAAFYPPAAAILGLMLATLLFFVPAADRGEAGEWSWRRRLVVLVVAGAFASALFAPSALAMRPWGRLLGPNDAALYPELGPRGRYGSNVIAPAGDLVRNARRAAHAVLRGGGAPLVPPAQRLVKDREAGVKDALLLVVLIGVISLAARDAAARRGTALPLAGAVGFVLARALSPYLYAPARYSIYTFSLFMLVFLPVSGLALAQLLSPARLAIRARAVGAILAGGVVLVFLGGHGNPWAGYTVRVDARTPVYEFIRGLPKEALVAGWPGGVIENVPYLCRRRAFVTYESHNVHHEGYVLEMRRRMDALIGALFSDDQRRLMELRDDFGVTHLIVNADDFSRRPWYFAPFDAELNRAWKHGRERGFALESTLARAGVWREGKLTVLDLAKL